MFLQDVFCVIHQQFQYSYLHWMLSMYSSIFFHTYMRFQHIVYALYTSFHHN